MAVAAGRRVGKLTARFVETVKQPGLYGDGGGLYLKVGDGGAKSWIVRWSSGGRVRKLGLGAVHTVTLVQARERATDVRRQILDGADPRAARSAVKTITFDDAATRYIASHQAGWTAKHVRQWRTTLATYVSPVLGRLPVDAIDTALVMKVLAPLWTGQNAVAFRLRGRIEAVLAWARVHGYRSGENPAVWRNTLDHLLPPPGKVRRVVHHTALPYDALPEFLRALRRRPEIAVRALELAILTATRTSEALNARRAEFDLANRLWIIPAARMKSERDHRVPLCARAVAIVAAVGDDDGYVFAQRGPTTLLKLLRRMGHAHVTVHGFRSTFRDWCAEQTDFPGEVAEMALAHAVGDRVEAAYRRSDLFERRRGLMDTWGTFCS